MIRLLVTGGRHYLDRDRVRAVLGKILAERGIAVMINGACPTGLDALAGAWAVRNGIAVEWFPADWNRLGKRAGPERNQRMIDEGKPDLVVAFPGGSGTADMVRRAHVAGIPVIAAG